jgi:uncharacterized protein (DUF1330 family)
LWVADQKVYTDEAAAMTPLLTAAGGSFRYDFEFGRMLRSEANHEINRIFVIRFPDDAARNRFFSDPSYVAIRARLFDQAVTGASVIAEYDR